MPDFYSTCSSKEQDFIKQLYNYYGQDLDRNAIFLIGERSKMHTAATTQFVRKLITNHYLENDSGYYFGYNQFVSLSEAGCLRSMIEYAKDVKKTKSLDNSNPLGKPTVAVSPSLKLIRTLTGYLLNGKEPEIDFDSMDDLAVGLLFYTCFYPEFAGMQHLVPVAMKNEQFATIANDCIFYLHAPEDMDSYYKTNIGNEKLTGKMKKEWTTWHTFVCRFMQGKFDNIDKNIDMDLPFGMCMMAYYSHLKGEVKEAIKLYEQSLSELSGKVWLPPVPLFAYSYALALVQDGSPESLIKIAAYLKKKEIKKDDNIIPFLIFSLPEEADNSKIMTMLDREMSLHPIATALYKAIYKYFYPSGLGSDLPATGNGKYILLTLEFYSTDPKTKDKYEALQKKIGFPSLISRLHRKEEWEKVLDALNGQTATGKPAENSLRQEMERVVYQFSPKSLYLAPYIQKSKNGGVTWTKGRAIALSRFSKGDLPEMDSIDKLVSGCVKGYKYGYYGTINYEMDSRAALLALAGCPRVFLAETDNIPVEVILSKPEMVISRAKKKFSISLNVDEADDNPIQVLVENDTRVKVMKLSPKQQQTIKLLKTIKELPPEAEEKLTRLLGNLNDIMTIHSDLIDTNGNMKTEQADGRVTVQLIPMGNALKAELFVKPLETEPPYCKPGKGAKSIVGKKDGEQVQVLRDFKKEKENYEIISGILQEISGEEEVEDSFVFEDPYDSLNFLDALRGQPDTTIIEWPEGAKFRITRQADLGNLSLSLKGKNKWFEMEGELNIGDDAVLSIQELLKKLRQSKGRFIRLGGDEFLALSERLKKRLLEIESATNEEKGKLKMNRFASIGFDKWGEGINLTGDKAYKDLKKRITLADDKEYNIPKQLNGELRDYQVTGFQWMARLADWGAGACLADDMGLGKTIQSIAMLLCKAKEGASLVVSPASVLLNWQTEINKFAPSLKVLVFNNADDRASMIHKAEPYDVVLSTYGLLVSEEKLMVEKQWNIAILDEAHTIKNRDTKTSKAAMKLDAAFRLILTGTPIQNHLGEIWNLFQFINPGLLGNLEQFTNRFDHPITQGDKDVQKRLKKLIAPFLLRRTKNEVLEELPPKTEIIKEIELSRPEMAFYENIRRQAELSLANGETNPLQALAEITRLRQAACNTALVDKEVRLPSSKEEAFLNIVDELIHTNHRALVFSQFTSHLALIRKGLDEKGITYLYLDGATPVKERAKCVKAFQTGEQPLFLISLKAGGLGLNLTAADYVIHLDPWWNPAIEDQASDRAYRIGQHRPVTVYRLIAKHTIEEKIIRLHITKKDMADSLLEGSDIAHKLTREELLELLR